MKKYLLIFRNSPYYSIKPLEGLELALAIAAFEQQVSIIFTDNGILQLLKNQKAGLIAFKDFTKAYKNLEIFSVNAVYINMDSLQELSLEPDDLLVQKTLIDTTKINELINQHEIVLTF